MTRAELEHAIRAACEVSGDTELWIFGSQAILGQYPSAPETLRQSAECDVVPKNRPERADLIDGVLGELFRIDALDVSKEQRERLSRWVEATRRELVTDADEA